VSPRNIGWRPAISESPRPIQDGIVFLDDLSPGGYPHLTLAAVCEFLAGFPESTSTSCRRDLRCLH
jgi:hypothetical protein